MPRSGVLKGWSFGSFDIFHILSKVDLYDYLHIRARRLYCPLLSPLFSACRSAFCFVLNRLSLVYVLGAILSYLRVLVSPPYYAAMRVTTNKGVVLALKPKVSSFSGGHVIGSQPCIIKKAT